jgi:ABC-type transport system substrate-binding protein
LPPLGIAATDDSTLVIRLARPDPLLLRKLALPGVAVPWSAKPGPGGWPSGLGAYRVIAASPGRLTLARGEAAAGRSARLSGTADPDTVYVRFVRGAGRVAVLVRAGVPDLVWPVPPGFDLSSLRGDYGVRARPAVPARRLLLIMRPDLPPTTKAPARQALAYGIDRPGVWAKLGRRGLPLDGWLPGAPAFDFPRRDPEQVRAWLDRGRFRRSLHVTLAYSADGAGAEAAPALQAEWARLGLDAERRPLEPSAFAEAARARSGAQLMLVENQPLLDDAAGELVTLVTPPRGPVIGSVRTGWMTREFDPWLRAGASQPLDPRYAQRRLAEDRIALPIANLPWFWIERAASPASFHPWFGPGSR